VGATCCTPAESPEPVLSRNWRHAAREAPGSKSTRPGVQSDEPPADTRAWTPAPAWQQQRPSSVACGWVPQRLVPTTCSSDVFCRQRTPPRHCTHSDEARRASGRRHLQHASGASSARWLLAARRTQTEPAVAAPPPTVLCLQHRWLRGGIRLSSSASDCGQRV
jgi:hypothetical protein